MEASFGSEYETRLGFSEESSGQLWRTWSSSSCTSSEEEKGNERKGLKKKQVLLEGYVEADEEDLSRTKSLTDEDLEELKGCLDLGFGFCYHEIPELCNTLPALELCYSMSQRSDSDSATPIASWKISSPGDHPEDVKARLKYWAQAVACTVRLCS